nr:MAG TPA: hypothetical protein [Bacteriophage sp.]
MIIFIRPTDFRFMPQSVGKRGLAVLQVLIFTAMLVARKSRLLMTRKQVIQNNE